TSGYVPGGLLQHLRWGNYAFFAQDTWKIRHGLSLNFGVRWEPFLPVDERDALALLPVLINNNPIETFRTNATLDFAGSAVGRPWYKSDYNNFAPNIGLAWDVTGDGRTSVRAGYSVSFVNDNVMATLRNSIITNRGLNTQSAATGISGRVSGGLPAIPIPVFKNPSTFADQYANNTSVGFGMPDPNLATPYVQQWNLSLQREIKGTVVEVRYLANKATKLYRGIDFNQVDINASGFLQDFLRARSNGNLSRAAGKGFDPVYNPEIAGSQPLTVFPQLGTGLALISGATGAAYRNLIDRGEVGELASAYQRDRRNGSVNFFRNPVSLGTNLMTNFSNSSYESLQVDLNHRFRSGFSFQANYVYGKVLSDSGTETDEQFEAFLDINNPKIERARATFDLTHAFKVNGTWDLPFGPGHHLNYSPLARLIEGWTLGGTSIWQSGAPFSILSQRSTLNRSGRSAVNTANTTLNKGQLDEIMGLRFSADGPFFVASSAISPTEGRGAASDGAPVFPGQVFFNPGPGTLGALQRRMFSGPSGFNMDLAVVKRVKLTERQSMEIRMDALNALNHPNFIIGDQVLDSTSFGRVTTTAFDRRIVQFALRYSF
ncbi:MAG: TonB-dependent receptor, partial [Bryobacteraceae bacterium]